MRYLSKHITDRLRSERGASLFMALMLFLVVLTVTSIALAAATSVSGRYSQLADMDRSYYNVTSAAKLFWDEMDEGEGATVTITRACDVEEDGDTRVGEAWTASIDDEFTIDEDNSARLEENTATLFQIVTASMVFRGTIAPTSPLRYIYDVDAGQVEASIDLDDLSPKDPTYSDAYYETFAITPKNGSSSIHQVDVTLKTNPYGHFEFVFEEPSDSSEASSFRCTLTANMSVDDSAPRITDLGNDKYHVEWVTTVHWKAEGLTTGGGTYDED